MAKKKMLMVRGTVEFSIDVATLLDAKYFKGREWAIKDELEHIAYRELDSGGESDVDFDIEEIEVDEEYAKEYEGRMIYENDDDF